MTRYYQWRENLASSSSRLQTLDSMLIEINIQLRRTLGVMSYLTGVKSDKDICSMLSNASSCINELWLKASHELDISEKRHENRKQSDGTTK